MRITLRPVGRGNWRALVLVVQQLPREQGYLFRDDEGAGVVKVGDVWMIEGREWRVAEVIR